MKKAKTVNDVFFLLKQFNYLDTGKKSFMSSFSKLFACRLKKGVVMSSMFFDLIDINFVVYTLDTNDNIIILQAKQPYK